MYILLEWIMYLHNTHTCIYNTRIYMYAKIALMDTIIHTMYTVYISGQLCCGMMVMRGALYRVPMVDG